MKTLPILALAAALAGCASALTTTTTSTTTTDQTEKRVHTQAELQKTGRPEMADALQTVDPSITVSRGGGH